MDDSTIRVIESQPDWLTLSCHTRDHTRELYQHAWKLRDEERANGGALKPFRLTGYVGWQCARVRYGERENAGLIQLSGDLAARELDALYPLRDSLTRLDLAVTAQLPALDDEVAARHYHEVRAWVDAHPRAALGNLVQDTKHGSTLYVGDRSSDFFLRVYNKQRECEHARDTEGASHYARSWRYELEIKGPNAGLAARSVVDSQERTRFIQAYLHGFATQHGLNPVFPPNGARELVRGFRRRSDRETRLTWLSTAVRPAVHWLLQQGDRDEVLHRLGLEAPPTNSNPTLTGS